MATFGTTSAAGVGTGGATDTLVATKYTLSESGTITNISVYCPNTGSIKVGIYSDLAGVPNLLVAVNNIGTSVSVGWNNITIYPTPLISGTYWIASLDSTGNLRGFVAGGVNQAAYNISVGYANGCPVVFPAVSNQNNDYVCYATYNIKKIVGSIYTKQGFQ